MLYKGGAGRYTCSLLESNAMVRMRVCVQVLVHVHVEACDP